MIYYECPVSKAHIEYYGFSLIGLLVVWTSLSEKTVKTSTILLFGRLGISWTSYFKVSK
jgi:hypothetical protein